MTGTNNPMLNNDGTTPTKRTAVADVAYTVLYGDYLIAYTSLTATRAVTLPPPSQVGTAANPKYYIIKDETGTAGTNNLTFAATIDGATGKAINANYGVMRIFSNGSAYFTW